VNSLGVVLAGLLAAGLLGDGACSESASRRQSTELMEAVQDAGSLVERALALLSGPPYKVEGRIAPVAPKDIPPDPGRKYEALIGEHVNPQALSALNEARGVVSAALQRAPKADAPVTALAKEMLGRVDALTGYYQARLTWDFERQLLGAFARAGSAASLLRSQAELAKCCEALAASAPQQAQRVLQESRQRQIALAADVKTKTDQIARLTQDRAGILKTNEAKLAQAGDLRVRSRLAGGEEGLRLLRQALDIEREISVASTSLAEMEHQIEALQIERNALEVRLRSVEGLATAVEKMVADRTRSIEQSAALGKDLQNAIGTSRQSLEALLGQVGDLCGRASAARGEARAAYERAAKAFAEAERQGREDATRASLATQQAEARMAAANLVARSLLMHDRCATFATDVQEAWQLAGLPTELPAGLTTARQYVSDPQADRDAAAKDLSEAVVLYERVRGRVDPRLRWIYQGELAAANLAIYQLTGGAEARTRAEAAIEEALRGGTESSPYLAPVVNLRRLLAASSRPAGA